MYKTFCILPKKEVIVLRCWRTNINNRKMATSNNEDEAISKLTQHIEDLSTNSDIILEVCANCGKEGSDLNICNKCKAATYCNAACKKKHRSKHKVACEKQLAELQEEELERKKRAAELHDEKLFKKPLPKEDCPICMILLPSLDTGKRYRSCCGKMICSGCIHAVAIRDGGVGLCPFCRAPAPHTDEVIEQMKKRVEIGDAEAIRNLGCYYKNGVYGLPQDRTKALELSHRAAKLGYTVSYYSIGGAYHVGNSVERDEKKASHYYELAAMGGVVQARYNLGYFEDEAGNMDRALKHYMIGVRWSGFTPSLEMIKQMFMHGDTTKDDYAKALQAYQANLVEIKSPQRDEAATFHDNYKYY